MVQVIEDKCTDINQKSQVCSFYSNKQAFVTKTSGGSSSTNTEFCVTFPAPSAQQENSDDSESDSIYHEGQ
jgi:hypothetical protein